MADNANKKTLIGDLSSTTLADVFQWISLSKKTGELFLQSENEEASIAFKNGEIVYATANQPRFLLGQLLLTYRKITKNQLIKALGIQKKTKRPLGQILVDLSVINKKDLEKMIVNQVHHIVYHILGWRTGFFYFIDKGVTSNVNESVNVDSVLMEGVQRLEKEKEMSSLFDDCSVIDNISYNGELLDYIDSGRTVGEIVRLAGGDWFETYVKIYEAINKGELKVAGRKETADGEDPILEFLVALELFNKNKIYEAYKIISKIIENNTANEQIKKFYSNLKLFISRYFYKRYGGENSCFSLNKSKLLDEKQYISPTEGFLLSRLEEYPCINLLEKSVNIDRIEIFLIVDKLYRLGLLFLKETVKNKTELMELNVVNCLLDVYKRELTGEMEVITEELSVKFLVRGGRFKFLYSVTDKYDIKNYLANKSSFTIDEKAFGRDVDGFIQKLMDDNGLALSDLEPILEIYQTMVFYEVINQKPISVIFNHEKSFSDIFNVNMNIIYLIIFSIVNNNLELKNNIDLSSDYEIIKDKEKIMQECGDLKVVRQIMDELTDNVLPSAKLRKLNKTKIYILNIFQKLGYLRESPEADIDVHDLEMFLEDIKNKDYFEIFEVSKDSYDLDTIKQKYIKLTKKYHPDLFSSKDHKKLAQDIFEIIKSAYDYLLEDEKNRKSENEGLKVDAKLIFLADQLLTSGKIYLNMGRLSDAIDAFNRAHENYPDDEEVQAFYALAKIRSGKSKEGYNILKKLDLEALDEPELYIAYIEACVKLKEKREAYKIIDKAMVKYPEYLKRLTAYQERLRNM